MILKKYLFFIGYDINLKVINYIKKICIGFCSFLFIYSIILSSFTLQSVEASTTEDNKFIERISKDYSRKFCNSLAFGLSKESSMTFANKENSLIFREKKGIDKLNKDLLANQIATLSIENCGYLIDLKGQQGIKEFKDDYISMNDNVL